MKKIIITLLIGFILFSIPVFSETYQYGVTADISENNTVFYKLNLIFVNHPNQDFSFIIENPLDIKIESPATCKIIKRVLETYVTCNMKAAERTDIEVTYISDENIKKRDNYFLFTDSFKLTDNTRTLFILVKLPEGTGLKEPIENSYNPTGALIGSDGRKTTLTWQIKDLKSGGMFDISVAFEKIGEVIPSWFPLEYVAVIIIISSAAFGLFYQIYLRDKGFKMILPILKKDEKIIFNTLMKHGSGVNQKVIVRDSGYSKAKVSKVLNSLRERGLIKLERIGRSNKVYIEKKFTGEKK